MTSPRPKLAKPQKQQKEQLRLFGDSFTPTPVPLTTPPAKRPSTPPERPTSGPKPACADCGAELIHAVSGKLWHTETETKLPSRGKRYLVPCPVTGSEDHGYADNTRSS